MLPPALKKDKSSFLIDNPSFPYYIIPLLGVQQHRGAGSASYSVTEGQGQPPIVSQRGRVSLPVSQRDRVSLLVSQRDRVSLL